jgi:peptide/nickel transport system permease protein
MLKLVTRRILLVIPLSIIAANFLGFAYSHLAQRFHAQQNPYGTSAEGPIPIGAFYRDYLGGVLRLDFGAMPAPSNLPILEVVTKAAGASLGLLAVAFVASLVLGLLLGFRSVKNEPAKISSWVAPLTAVGQAMPSYYIGTIFILWGVYTLTRGGPDAHLPLPLFGFGWDLHLILPVIALMVHPTMQIAQLTASLLAGELNKQYIIAVRSHGVPWRLVRWKHALGNVLAPVILTVARSFRLLVGELILVEWLFDWPGIGQMLARTLVPPSSATVSGLANAHHLFLAPELVAALLSIFTLIFVATDTIVTIAIHAADPRLRSVEAGGEK